MKIFFLFVICFLMTLTVSAQDHERFSHTAQVELARKKDVALDAIANLSPALNELRDNPVEMIIEAAKLDNPDLQSHLKVLAHDGQARSIQDSVEFQAHLMLAKLGEPFAIQEIFSELDNTKHLIRRGAVAKLARIGSKEAYRKLYVLLDNTRNLNDTKSIDEVIRPNSQLVMEELGKLFKDVPREPNGVVKFDIDAWKAWFEKNKHLIE